MIWRIGKMLRLQAKSRALSVTDASFATRRAIQEISGVELHTGFRGPHLQHAASRGFYNTRSQRDRIAWFLPQDKIVVVAAAQLNLLVICIDARANRGWFAEIKRRSGDVAKLPRRNQVGIHRSEFIRLNHEHVAKNIA